MSFYKNKKILVTGGAGFIGSHIVETLVQYGAHVTILDNFSTGSQLNLEGLKDHITIIDGSVADYTTCLKTTDSCSHVFHLAAMISVPDSMKQPLKCHNDNVTGTINILEASRHNNVQHVIFSSSSAVYGQHSGICTETTACKPESPYGWSKYMGEQYCKLYAKQYNLSTTCLRYFNVYGQRQNPDGSYAAVVVKFSKLLAQNKPITIFGDGKQTRDFISVSEVVKANLFLGTIPNAQGDIYNIATGKSISLLDLVEQLKNQHPSYSSGITFAPARKGDIYHSLADCQKYHQKIEALTP